MHNNNQTFKNKLLSKAIKCFFYTLISTYIIIMWLPRDISKYLIWINVFITLFYIYTGLSYENTGFKKIYNDLFKRKDAKPVAAILFYAIITNFLCYNFDLVQMVSVSTDFFTIFSKTCNYVLTGVIIAYTLSQELINQRDSFSLKVQEEIKNHIDTNGYDYRFNIENIFTELDKEVLDKREKYIKYKKDTIDNYCKLIEIQAELIEQQAKEIEKYRKDQA